MTLDNRFPPLKSQRQIDDEKRPGDWPSGWWVLPGAIIGFIVLIAMVIS